MKHPIYLDYAAATPMDSNVKLAMERYFSEAFYNPSALYLASKAVSSDINDARSLIAYWLGARPSEIIFTAGGTEANNLAIHGLMSRYPNSNLVVSGVEHESVLRPASHYERKAILTLPDGRIDLDSLRALTDDKTVLISVMYANNEVGTIQPIKDVAQIVTEIRKDRQKRGVSLPLYLHTDACQAANYLDLQTSRLGVDLMTLNAGKIYGPKQTGVLYLKSGIILEPQITGGGQERNMRSGTENVANCVGFSLALDIAQKMRHTEGLRLAALQTQFIKHAQQELPDVIVNGSLKHRLPNNIHITLNGQDNERLLMKLDEQGVMCATGSACTASSDEPSHVLKAMGVSDANAQSSLRFTMGRSTTSTDIKTAVDMLVSATSSL